MGKNLCARCGKEIVGKYAYMSRLDTNLVCQECWDKEQPAVLIKQNNELEIELSKYKKLLADKTHQFDSVRQRYHLLNRLQATYDKKDKLHLSEMQCLELVELNEKLTAENESLKAELKSVGVPKYKYHQIVYGVFNTDIVKGQIDAYDSYTQRYFVYFGGFNGKFNEDPVECFGSEWCCESELYSSKASALKSIKKRSEGNE